MRNRLFMGPLMDSDPGVSGSGDKAILDEAKVNTLINSALAKFGTTTANTIKEQITAAMGSLTPQLTTLTENLTALQTSIKPPVDEKDKNKPGDDGLTPAARAEFQKIQKALDTANANFATEKTAREKAEAASALDRRNTAIRTELGQFQYHSTEAQEDAFAAVNSKIEQDAEGNYVADGLLLKDFVADFIPGKKAYLLKAEDKSGSGASRGSGRGAPTKVMLEDITTANMKDPKKAAATAAAILDAFKQGGMDIRR